MYLCALKYLDARVPCIRRIIHNNMIARIYRLYALGVQIYDFRLCERNNKTCTLVSQ